jgi:hypothetical protein
VDCAGIWLAAMTGAHLSPGTQPVSARFKSTFPRFLRRTLMDQHDQELLDKQLKAIYQPPRQAGVVILAILGIFLGGMIAGTLLSAETTSTTAANGPALAFLDAGAPVTRN